MYENLFCALKDYYLTPNIFGLQLVAICYKYSWTVNKSWITAPG